MILELWEGDFWEVGADVIGVAGVDMLPGGFHAWDFGSIGEFGEKRIFELFWHGARKHTSGVHLGIAEASKTKINDADDFVVFI